MATIITRAGKGSPLENDEVDANFTNLNDDKLESGDLSVSTGAASGGGTLAYTSGVFTFAPADLTSYITDLSSFTTTDLTEGTNLYYTDERVDDRVNALIVAGLGITTTYDDAAGTLTIDSDTIEELCKNGTGSTILKGTPVYQTGTAGNAMVIAPADASSAATMPAVGVLSQDLVAAAEGNVILMGRISGVDTSAFSEGDVIYVASGGGYTNVRPTGQSVLVQNLGRVTKVHASNGGGVIMGAGRSNDVPNLTNGNIFIGNASGTYDKRAIVTADISDLTATATELNYTDGVTSAIQTQLNSKLPSSSYTAADVLAKIVTVDGTGSGLDADLLDGQQGSYYYPASNPNGYTTSVGDITGVTAGVGLSGGGTSGTVTLTVDLSELTDMTAAMVGTDEFIVLDASADRRKAANEIGLSIFNNDAGFTTNVGDITGVTAGSYLTGGGTSGAVTLNVDATSANTASKVVARDASGNFAAGTITAALTGNSSTATTLQTTRTINGVSFDGSANITVADATKLPLTGGTLTGSLTGTSATFNTSVNIDGHVLQDSADRSGLLGISTALGTWKGIQIISTGTAYWSIMGDQDDFGIYDDINNEWILQYNENSSLQLNHNGITKLTTDTNGVIISGTATATTFSGALSGNATTATTLATARTINGVSFNGSANITVADATKLPLTGGVIAGNLDINGNLNAAYSVYVADHIYHEGDTDTRISFGTNTITLIAGGSSEITVNTTGVRLGDTGNGYFQPVTGSYGSIQVDGGAHGGFEGYSIGGRVVFMHDNSSTMGLYDDVNNHWALKHTLNGATELYHDGTARLTTNSTGVDINGSLRSDDLEDGAGVTKISYDSSSYFSGTFSDKVTALGNTGTAKTIDCSTANVFTATLTGNCTFTLSTPNSTANRATSFTLVLTNDATASRTVVLSGGTFKYPGGTISRTTDANATDIWFFFSPDGGTTWYVTMPAKDLTT